MVDEILIKCFSDTYFVISQHGTCPVCRKDLNGSDTTTTEFDANIGETIGSIDPDALPLDNSVTSQGESSTPGDNSNNSARRSDRNDNRGHHSHHTWTDDDID